jgi:CubicO group peptidase (beta-lactamase class C family)
MIIVRALVPTALSILATACVYTSQHTEDAASPDTAAPDRTRTTADIERLLERYDAPSASVAVISDGEITYARSFGLQDIENGVPASTETQYAIGSIVKTFTSALIGTLEADGTVNLTSGPSEYVNDLKFRTEDLSDNLTLTNLLSQTSGLPNMDGSYVFFPEEDQADLAPRFRHFDATCRVGDCWVYNNMNYLMLDMVAESVTRQSKSELLSQRLLTPAGMTGTVSSTEAFSRSGHAAVGYTKIGDAMSPTQTEYLFGEQIYATAPDMARWADLWMSQGGGVIPEDYVKRATSMQAIEDGSPPQENDPGTYLFGYGYGWQVKSVEGHYVVHHGGNENGFTAQVLFVPASGIGFVTLTNQQNSILPYVINDLLLRRELGLPETGVEDYPVSVGTSAALLSPEAAKLKINPDAPLPFEPDQLSGTYSAAGYGNVQVQLVDDILTLSSPAAEFVLVHQGEATFGLASTKPLSMGINIDFFEVTFAADSLSMNISSEPVVFEKSYERL